MNFNKKPTIAGPKRPQDRISLAEAKQAFRRTLASFVDDTPQKLKGYDEAPISGIRKRDPISITLSDGTECQIDHGSVVIAAITSCTNTSNPTVMMAAALLAKNAVEKGLARKSWVKTSLAPGSRVITDYYDRAEVKK